jgi:hypothetical protein
VQAVYPAERKTMRNQIKNFELARVVGILQNHLFEEAAEDAATDLSMIRVTLEMSVDGATTAGAREVPLR